MYRHLKLTLGIVLGLGAASVASAADMAVKARPMLAPNPYYWTGCYIGGNAGGGWSRMHTVREQIDTVPPTPAFFDYGTETDSGFLGGGQFGCDFQTTNFVFGVDLKADFGDVHGSHNTILGLPGFSEANKLQQVYLLTGRVGYLWTPQLLGYLRVGAAFLQNKNSVFMPGGALFETARFTDPGITAGIGFEYMFAPSWSVFAEANFIWSEADDAAHDFRPSPAAALAGNPGEVINDRQRTITALVGVNYKFHWDNGPPVVAKY
jgi:outer membrane immunogenic protein